MGKTTNKLEEIVNTLKKRDRKKFLGLIEELELFHEDILADLFPEKHFSIYNTIEAIFEQLKEKINKPFSENTSFEYDQIVSLGEVISSHIVAAYLTEQNFSAHLIDARQLVRTDNNYQEGKVDWLKTEALIKTKLFPDVLENSTSVSFSHIFPGGYSSGYYSYKWAEVLDADAFEYFKENGIFNPKIGKAFADNVLSKGGTEHPMTLYKRFRGQEPKPEALLKRAGLAN